ncbi:hypothetical protein DRW07_08460 [Alteromonas sediminis]|uniref:Lipoprotein n=1 Tax=Alteromonas sediminis TaxID=2259342 RepID=A0A3N5Y3T3_9ALTE|nr:DUF6279 family lipoprotein [Alteromonas sediminis]RPJ67536.1 hypothetical protein DRW07_08460 [Alteromonas sediminis]
MFKKVFCLILVLTLTGCSTKFAYNNFDWLVYWYLDDYIELNDEQEAFFDSKVAKWMTWHRQEELGKYKAQLESIKHDIKNGHLDEQTIARHMEQGTAHFERVREKVTPALVEMALDINEEQITYLFASLEKENVKQEKRMAKRRKGGPEKRLEKRIESITDEIEDNIGRLSSEQKRIVEKYAALFIATGDDWIAYRRLIQNEARQLFANRDSNPEFAQQLTTMMLNPDSYRSPEYAVNRDANRAQSIALMVELGSTLSDKQKSKLIEEINDIISDLDDLMEKT